MVVVVAIGLLCPASFKMLKGIIGVQEGICNEFHLSIWIEAFPPTINYLLNALIESH